MAPMTRRSQAAASAATSNTPAPATANNTTGVSKPVTRRSRAPVTNSSSTRKDQSNSWELLDRNSSRANDEDIAGASESEREGATARTTDMDFSTTARTTRGAAQTAADSLRDIADRVGKEVEVFAETLDRFFDNLPTAQDQYDAAHDLVLEFKGIAEMAVEDLKTGHEREVRDQLRTEWSEQAHLSAFESAGRANARMAFSGPAAARKREQVEELRLCQEEADTWELFRIVLETHYNPNTPSQDQEKEEKLSRLGNVHRYTPESELYDRFLLEDDLARERQMVKSWLEQTAEHQKSDVQGIVEELEERAGAGKGTWTRGWMHTREKIKAEKRMRTWPQPDSSPLPQIRRTDNSEMLVTSLDPDAPARQERTLEKQDAYIERAFWIACYEMLRRGKSWSEVCDWCEERKEGWRAVVMGKTMATSDAASGMAWRKMCFLASRSETVGDYEAAVYGLLGGNVEAVKKISRSVDDHLYAHYNAILIQQFDHYLQTNYPQRIPQALQKRGYAQDSVADANAAQLEILTLINGLRKTSTTKHESTTPIKMLQSYLLANECESLVHTVGTAISEAKNISGNAADMTNRIRALVKYGSGYPEDKIVTDLRSLRITTHICLILQVLRTEELQPEQVDIEDNVVDAYIQELRTAGKRDNTPTYASRLQKERYMIALSRVFQDVSSPRERQELLSLVEGFGLDPKDILWELTNFLQDELFGTRTQARALRILESSDEDLYPGQRIKAGSLPSEVEPQEEAFVMSFEWFLQAQGYWTETFAALNKGLRDCLYTGRFACARAIVETYPYDLVSKQKSHHMLGRSVNVANDDSGRAISAEEAPLWDLMYRQSRPYHHMEQLVHAFEALAHWREEEILYREKIPLPSSVPSSLKNAFEAVETCMAPLVQPSNPPFLSHPDADAGALEDKDNASLIFARLRDLYLPEALIAYNTVLHSAGYLITRESLLKSMDLSVAIARDSSDPAHESLTGPLVRAGRMRELVKSFALSARAMLVLKGLGHKPWRPRRDREGKDPGIWEIGPQGRKRGEEEGEEGVVDPAEDGN